MAFEKTMIEGAYIFTPNVFEDKRGYFFESYNKKLFIENGIDANFVQDNQSFSSLGTVRGLHFQKGEFSQAKLVRAVQGVVLDVVLDLRRNSPSFGKHIAVKLSEENKKQLFVPKGCAHGFAVLSKTALFSYKCDALYAPGEEGGVVFDDKELNIDWQTKEEDRVVSEKDAGLPTFSAYKENPCF